MDTIWPTGDMQLKRDWKESAVEGSIGNHKKEMPLKALILALCNSGSHLKLLGKAQNTLGGKC